MIIDAIFSMVIALAQAVVDALPTVELDPLEVPSIAIATNVVEAVFPFEQALIAVGVMLGWVLFCHLYRIVLWVLGLLHITGNSV